MQTSENTAVGQAAVAGVLDPNLVTLTPSSLIGFMILYRGVLMGWLQQDGTHWNAYAPTKPPNAGEHLGIFACRDRAVRQAFSPAVRQPALAS
ncbi:hypothetical protein GCM10009828_067980 [Actinoplanes couchii]|uniref:Uncharacterized protein n=2 Tax=Actinoplanes couchii TaxID=403638 RepID=A0ABQ3XTX3_9ACTN|nr:hypothetical protein Aco03nite_103650 [Actinoplanes couchii]